MRDKKSIRCRVPLIKGYNSQEDVKNRYNNLRIWELLELNHSNISNNSVCSKEKGFKNGKYEISGRGSSVPLHND